MKRAIIIFLTLSPNAILFKEIFRAIFIKAGTPEAIFPDRFLPNKD